MAKVFDIKDNHKVAYKQGAVLGHKKNSEGVYGAVEGTFTRDGGATRVGKNGLIESVADGVPQVDFEGGNSAYVLEPSRMNLITHSEDFSDSSWLKLGDINISNGYFSPSGEQNAYNIQSGVSGVNWILHQNSTGDGTYTFSVWCKGFSGKISLSDYVSSSNELSLDVDYNSDWVRYEVTHTTSNGGFRANIYPNNGESGYIWGAQVEQFSYATSYIPTNGTTITRNESTLTGFGNEYLFNSSEGVLFAEIAALDDDGSDLNISINDGSISNTLRIRYNLSSEIECIFLKGGSTQLVISDNLTTINQFNKIAVSYKDNNTKLYVNGVEIGDNTTSTYNISFSELSFNRGGGGSPFYGKVKQLQVYDTALTDAELIALTS